MKVASYDRGYLRRTRGQLREEISASAQHHYPPHFGNRQAAAFFSQKTLFFPSRNPLSVARRQT